MKNPNETQPTRAQLDRLLADLPIHLVGADAGHVAEDWLFDYALGRLSLEVARQVEDHVAACAECRGEVGDMAEGADEWSGAEGRRRLEALGPISGPRTEILTLPERYRGYTVAVRIELPRAAAEEVKEWQVVEDDEFGIAFHEEPDGSLVILFDSRRVGDWKPFVLVAGEWRREVPLNRLPSGREVGARVVISREERASMPRDTDLTIELLPG